MQVGLQYLYCIYLKMGKLHYLPTCIEKRIRFKVNNILGHVWDGKFFEIDDD
jgi:hypothetical protein